ncbi:MAG: metallophosphoesterase [Candidatus Saccharibacteria bacterium]|nr:metallophosphoesterase [Candidatus Saccharibacteria bacterium]
MVNKLKFGVVADPQYGNCEAKRNKDCQGSLERMREAVEEFNRRELDFVAILGDIVEDNEKDYAMIMAEIGKIQTKKVMMIGNHDYYAAGFQANDVAEAEKRALKNLGMSERYYSFSVNGYRVIVMDTNEGLLEAGGGKMVDEVFRVEEKRKGETDYYFTSEHPWNGWIFQEQREWIRREILVAEEAGEKVIMMGHTPIFSQPTSSVRNGNEIAMMVREHEESIVAVLAGHEHLGGLTMIGWVPQIVFRGMLLPGEATYSVVEVSGMDIKTEGFGRENQYRMVR